MAVYIILRCVTPDMHQTINVIMGDGGQIGVGPLANTMLTRMWLNYSETCL